ncbi:MAG: hypothetical protein L0206_10905, partial [Actinobacteria bacterium]|nr:hypothetical protein [Actinomycetota bacterium]
MAALACLAGTDPVEAQQARPRIAFDPATTYQTIDGWEATVDMGELLASYQQFDDEVIRRIVDDVGVNRLRLEIRAGAEHTNANWKLWRESADPDQTYPTWRGSRYATVDDNGDPDVIDWDGFHFEEIDDHVEHRVIPIRDRVESRGEKLQVNLCYVAFTGQIASPGTYHHDDPEEYAEFVLATFLHLRDAWDLVPDTFEVILEPDNTAEWTGNLIGRALVETDRRLSAEGFHPGFVAPSTTSTYYAHRFFDDIAKVSGATDVMTEISYHRYQHSTAANVQEVANRAAAYGLKAAQLEWIGATYEELHEDLTTGMNSSWSQYVIAANGSDYGGGYLFIDESGSSPVIRLGSRTRFLRLYFLWVRQGAVRVRATSTDSALDPLGFVNADDRPTVVVKATESRSFDVAGLPAGNYGIRYATSSQESVDLADV